MTAMSPPSRPSAEGRCIPCRCWSARSVRWTRPRLCGARTCRPSSPRCAGFWRRGSAAQPLRRGQADVRAGAAPAGDLPRGNRLWPRAGRAQARRNRLGRGEAPRALPGGAPAAEAGPGGLALPAPHGGRTDLVLRLHGAARDAGIMIAKSNPPAILLRQHLRKLELPTVLRGHEKSARLPAFATAIDAGLGSWDVRTGWIESSSGPNRVGRRSRRLAGTITPGSGRASTPGRLERASVA